MLTYNTMKNKITVYTNLISGGWSYKDLETGIGGSEEILIQWAEFLAMFGHDVTIYMNGEHGDFKGVKYRDHREYKPWEDNGVFVGFKCRDKMFETRNARKNIYWSHSIEDPINHIDKFICLSPFHKDKIKGGTNLEIIPNFVNFTDLDLCYKEKDNKPTMLYSSSFDRGLEDLLKEWETVRENLGIERLYITYGWEFWDAANRRNPRAFEWKQKMTEMMEQDGIEFLGRVDRKRMNELYWQSHFWCLPLNEPTAELFCINAVKAQFCRALPVVNYKGALESTVNLGIHFNEIKEGQSKKPPLSHYDNILLENRLHVRKFTISKVMNQWKELLS